MARLIWKMDFRKVNAAAHYTRRTKQRINPSAWHNFLMIMLKTGSAPKLPSLISSNKLHSLSVSVSVSLVSFNVGLLVVPCVNVSRAALAAAAVLRLFLPLLVTVLLASYLRASVYVVMLLPNNNRNKLPSLRRTRNCVLAYRCALLRKRLYITLCVARARVVHSGWYTREIYMDMYVYKYRLWRMHTRLCSLSIIRARKVGEMGYIKMCVFVCVLVGWVFAYKVVCCIWKRGAAAT